MPPLSFPDATGVAADALRDTVQAPADLHHSRRHVVVRLVAKSLVVADTASGSGRHRLLETVRAYGADRLEEAGEAAERRRAHARFYLELGEEAEPELTGPSQVSWLERLQPERQNLRLALEWSLGHGQTEWALRLAAALVLYWRVRCHFSEGRDLLAAAVSVSDGAPEALRAKALWGAGFLTLMAGDTKRAIPALEQSLARARKVGDVQACARALLVLANCTQHRADPQALSLLEESAGLARQAGDSWCLAHALALAGFQHIALNDPVAAGPLFEDCLAVARQAEDRQGLRFGLLGVGLVALHQGDYGSAESLVQEGLVLAHELGEDYVEAVALQYLGQLALARGDYGRARRLHAEALGRAPEGGRTSVGQDLLLLLARVSHAEGDRPGARLLFEKVLAGMDRNETSIPALQGLGELAVEEGDPGAARRLLEEARDLARGIGDKGQLAQALHALGQLARAAGDAQRAAALHTEALGPQRQIGDAPAIVASLEAVAGLAGSAGRKEHAAKLLGAAEAVRTREGYARRPRESFHYESDLALVRQGLSNEEFQAAWAMGAQLSLDDAVSQALKGRGRNSRPASGWPSLTDAEHQVAALVAERLTNPEIAERLFMSLGTVKTHLSHIFSKLGKTSRKQLGREVRRRQEEPSMSDSESARETARGTREAPALRPLPVGDPTPTEGKGKKK